MEYITLTKSNNFLSGNHYIFDANNIESYTFNVIDNGNVSIVFINMTNTFELHFNIKNNASVKLAFLQEKPLNLKINGEILRDSNLTCYFADFADEDIKVATDIKLKEENAKCYWNLASLSKNHKYVLRIFSFLTVGSFMYIA